MKDEDPEEEMIEELVEDEDRRRAFEEEFYGDDSDDEALEEERNAYLSAQSATEAELEVKAEDDRRESPKLGQRFMTIGGADLGMVNAPAYTVPGHEIAVGGGKPSSSSSWRVERSRQETREDLMAAEVEKLKKKLFGEIADEGARNRTREKVSMSSSSKDSQRQDDDEVERQRDELMAEVMATMKKWKQSDDEGESSAVDAKKMESEDRGGENHLHRRLQSSQEVKAFVLLSRPPTDLFLQERLMHRHLPYLD